MTDEIIKFPCSNPIILEKLTNEFGVEFFHLHLNEFEILFIGRNSSKNIVVRHFSDNEDDSITLMGEWEIKNEYG
ncbi:hypothetical protein LCGC14_0856870 [marine sediment metagenome]|uniref:Uncharacterized protein n=1 Tax=marine sediment metagenome TaxID=412755 RepID=A0A0F9RT67_9ZZZZ